MCFVNADVARSAHSIRVRADVPYSRIGKKGLQCPLGVVCYALIYHNKFEARVGVGEDTLYGRDDAITAISGADQNGNRRFHVIRVCSAASWSGLYSFLTLLTKFCM